MLYVVGFGAGDRESMTIGAESALKKSDLIVGYRVYTDLMKKLFPEKEFFSTGMRGERERVEYALKQAADGRTVALVCSGDSEVYGMAGLTYELSPRYPSVEIAVVAGVTSALSGGAILGAPLTGDFAVISLSDLLTPSEKIELRLRHAARADLAIVLYNPASKGRPDHLKKACEILLEYKPPETICGYVKNIGRAGERHAILTLSELKDVDADMFTTVFVGSSETKVVGDKMVAPRGYKNV
ncbi:MAG: precorrin-3B C(17)-methyltransferase [Bacteroides sp.]|nr:precorrin-3B C(17)-methyltransferase [Eubacterium sp.]MCM1417862.1 precorrin-3B C(17)-methyltransferase [Roseburia sp.]MCM1461301.1 precorrin-3B C(17)-methyltransferase [Bacteroides sp.]